MKKNVKTQLAKSLHQLAIDEISERRTNKVRNNWESQLFNTSLVETSTNHVTENSALKDIFNAMCEVTESEYQKMIAICAFRAKYSKLYSLYSCDIDNDIDEMMCATNELTHDLDGNENTPLNCIKSFVNFGVKNDVFFCTPMREENKRYLDGIKEIKKAQKTEQKAIAKNIAKVVAKTSKSDWIQKQVEIMMNNGVDENTAKMCAEMMYNNLQNVGK